MNPYKYRAPAIQGYTPSPAVCGPMPSTPPRVTDAVSDNTVANIGEMYHCAVVIQGYSPDSATCRPMPLPTTGVAPDGTVVDISGTHNTEILKEEPK